MMVFNFKKVFSLGKSSKSEESEAVVGLAYWSKPDFDVNYINESTSHTPKKIEQKSITKNNLPKQIEAKSPQTPKSILKKSAPTTPVLAPQTAITSTIDNNDEESTLIFMTGDHEESSATDWETESTIKWPSSNTSPLKWEESINMDTKPVSNLKLEEDSKTCDDRNVLQKKDKFVSALSMDGNLLENESKSASKCEENKSYENKTDVNQSKSDEIIMQNAGVKHERASSDHSLDSDYTEPTQHISKSISADWESASNETISRSCSDSSGSTAVISEPQTKPLNTRFGNAAQRSNNGLPRPSYTSNAASIFFTEEEPKKQRKVKLGAPQQELDRTSMNSQTSA